MTGSRRGFVRRARAALDDAAAAVGGPRVRAQVSLVRGVVAMLDNDYPEAEAPLAEAQRLLAGERADVAWELNVVQEFTFQRLLWTGALRELGERLPPALEDARERGNEHLGRALTLRFGYLPALLADDPIAAESALLAARAGWWPARFSTLDCFFLWSRGDVLLYATRSRGFEARAHVEGAWGALERSPFLSVQALAMAALNVRARAALAFAGRDGATVAERAVALRDAASSARRLRGLPNLLQHGLADLVEAGLADAEGDAPAAILGFARAEAAFVAAGSAHYVAAARRRRGAILGGDEGLALVGAADAFFRDQGARDPARLAAVYAPSGRPPAD